MDAVQFVKVVVDVMVREEEIAPFTAAPSPLARLRLVNVLSVMVSESDERMETMEEVSGI